MAAPATSSLRKCIHSKIRDVATLAAQKNNPGDGERGDGMSGSIYNKP
jgi:hypothetical protein